MKKYELKNPYCMGDEAWEALTEEEKDRAILSWLIVIKLSTAHIRDLQFCRAYLASAEEEEARRNTAKAQAPDK